MKRSRLFLCRAVAFPAPFSDMVRAHSRAEAVVKFREKHGVSPFSVEVER